MEQNNKNDIGYGSGTNKPKRKWSYAWITVIASGVVLFTSANLQYTFGVFLIPLIDTFGWSRAAVSGSVSCRSLVSAAINPITGYLSDRYGPKPVIFIGILLSGLAYITMSRINSLWGLYAAMSVLMGLAMGCLYTPLMATVTKWFGKKAAFANGILLATFGLAQIVIPPTAIFIILRWGWKVCFVILGITAWGAGIAAWLFVKAPPKDIPQGQRQELDQDMGNPGREVNGEYQDDDYSFSEALHTRTLWVLLMIYLINAICFHMFNIHIVATAIDTGFSLKTAAFILTLSGIANTLGRVGVGGLATRIGNKVVLSCTLALQVPMLLLLANAKDILFFCTATAIYSFAYGGTSPIIPTLAGSLFGKRATGALIGLTTTAYTTGIAIGPFVAGYIFDKTGSYFWAYTFAGITAATAFLLSFFLKPPCKKIKLQ